VTNKRWWIGILAGGGVLALAMGGLIWHTQKSLEERRVKIAGLRTEIANSRKLLTGTSMLEREVIVLRETENKIKEILPDEEDLNNMVRRLREFEEDSGVRITGLKKKDDSRAAARNAPKEQFKKVAYSVTLEADAFQLLSFFDEIESHARFMSIPIFKLTAATRRKVEETGIAAHKVQADVETYVYEPQDVPDAVKIEGYERKRELLLGEINRRRQALTVPSYEFRGERGRRDPWIDPRVPAASGGDTLSLEQQLAMVEKLITTLEEIDRKIELVAEADNIIVEMTERADLEGLVADLEEELRRIEEQNAISIPIAMRRLEREVLEPLEELRTRIEIERPIGGPDLTALTELAETMGSHLKESEYRLAIEAYRPFESELPLAEEDPERRSIVRNCRKLAHLATVALEFDERPMEIDGIAIMEGTAPLILIDGETYQEGDLLDDELMIRSVRTSEVEFIYRGVILIRHF